MLTYLKSKKWWNASTTPKPEWQEEEVASLEPTETRNHMGRAAWNWAITLGECNLS